LYNRRTAIAIFLVLLLVSKIVSASIGAYIGFPHQRFSPSCLVITGSQPALYLFAVGELVFQSAIIGLTLSRHISAARGGWSTPLVSLVSRQGSMVFAAISVAMIGAIAAGLQPVNATHKMFPAMIIILSTAGCRLIINMQRLADPVPEPDPILTTMNDNDVWADTEISFYRGEDGSTISRSSIISSIDFNMLNSTK